MKPKPKNCNQNDCSVVNNLSFFTASHWEHLNILLGKD